MARDRCRPFMGRIRFQLGGALVFAVLAPIVLRWPIETLRLNFIVDRWQMNSSIAAALAIMAGYVFVRQFNAYPGARATTYILPSLAASFGAIAMVLVFSRIEYSRYLLLTSFAASVAWFYLIFHLRSRHALPRLALVPGGNHRGIAEIGFGANWMKLTSPQQRLAGVEAVVADLRGCHGDAWDRFIAQCVLAGIPVYDVKTVIESLTGRVEIEQLSENSFGSVLPSNLYLRIKRVADLMLVAVLALPVALVVAAAAVFIRIESRGPVFFTQPRMGYRGRTFRIYKLRSMHVGAAPGLDYTAHGDSRITRVGRFIRKYRIDELPQIINIAKGEMSWIGPRPEAITLAEWYATYIPFYIYRHAVRPGISGWAQVNQGNVAEVEAAAKKLQYDFYYIKNFSPWLDLLIVLKTLRTIVTGFGSR